MYNGYTEADEKIDARKQRILGTKAPPNPRQTKERYEQAMRRLKREALIMAVLFTAAVFLGGLLGELIQALMR